MTRCRQVFALAAVALLVSSCDSGLSQGQGEEFFARWRTLYDSHDLAGFSELYVEEGNYAVPGMVYFTRTRAEMRETMDTIWRRFPDMRLAANARVVASGDQIAVFGELLFTTRQGPVRQGMATLLRLRDGRIVQQTLVVRR